MYIKELRIGNVKLKNNVILAPMAGITDKAFRLVCGQYNPGLVVTEMASARAIYHNDKKTKRLIDLEGEERPISVQIFGSDEESIKAACEYASEFADIIDINMGCPAPKVVKNGDGSKLLLDLELAERIIKQAVISSSVPVTVKIRSGWDSDHIVAVDIAKIAERAGASMITIHGRTREQFYTGTADLDIIKSVKENVKIPVIGNGDIKSVKDAINMFEYTKVDGIMIGRGAIGKPWIFEQIINMEERAITNEERLRIILKHIDLACQIKGETVGVKEMRKHIPWYIKNFKDATKLREKVNSITTKDELETELTKFFIEDSKTHTLSQTNLRKP